MHKNSKKIILFLGIIFALFLKVNFASALEITSYPTIFGHTINDTSNFSDLICYLYGIGIIIAAFIAVLTMAFGGIYYLVSYGRGKFTSEAKEWIKSGILGLLIVLCSALIIKTINPDLGSCTFIVLPDVSFTSSDVGTTPGGSGVTTYKEIPIGTLAEKLLTRTLHCYSFDQYGDPIYQSQAVAGTGAAGNSYIEPERDRVECIMQLIEAAQKKTQVIAELSKQITNLMNNKCDCNKYGNCKAKPDSCVLQGSGNNSGTDGDCTSAGGMCKPADGINCAPTWTGDSAQDPGCCDPSAEDGSGNAIKDHWNNNGWVTGDQISVRYQIEHGPIVLSYDVDGNPTSNCPDKGCCTNIKEPEGQQKTPSSGTKQFRGLDEFRCDESAGSDDPNRCTDIQSLIAVHVDPEAGEELPEFAIDPNKWNNITLVQQLQFIKEQLKDNFQGTLGADVKELDKAKHALDKCYLAIPYVDLLKTYKIADSQNRVILKEPQTYKDALTSKTVDPAKYCLGFNYAGSTCYKKCNDLCPDSSEGAIQGYQSCTKCSPGDTSCLDTQAECLKQAYDSRPCPNSTGDDAPSTFKDCITKCQTGCGSTCKEKCKTSDHAADCIVQCEQNDCQDNCSQKYLPCSTEYELCEKQQYTENSKCILDTADPKTGNNARKCLFSESFIDCSNRYTDQGNSDYCINNAYLCKNGSNEYAGYLNCIDTKTTTFNCLSITDEESCWAAGTLKNQCTWDGKKCVQNYSGSFFYDNTVTESGTTTGPGKCNKPYEPAPGGSYCYSSQNPTADCKDICPDTNKCPTSSSCPDCPCDKIDDWLALHIPNKSYPGTVVTQQDEADCATKQEQCFKNENCSSGACLDKSGSNPPNNKNMKSPQACQKDSDCAGVNPLCNDASCMTICTDGLCQPDNSNNPGYDSTTTQEVLGSVMVGPECNEYSYNDDPLTFYCEDGYCESGNCQGDWLSKKDNHWWNDPSREGQSPVPVGEERACPTQGEVPVGQMVDSAESWAAQLSTNIDNVVKNNIDPVLTQMKKVGKAIETDPVQNYCKCDAQLSNGHSICNPNCDVAAISDSGDPGTYSCPDQYTPSDTPLGSDSTCSAYHQDPNTYSCPAGDVYTNPGPDGQPSQTSACSHLSSTVTTCKTTGGSCVAHCAPYCYYPCGDPTACAQVCIPKSSTCTSTGTTWTQSCTGSSCGNNWLGCSAPSCNDTCNSCTPTCTNNTCTNSYSCASGTSDGHGNCKDSLTTTTHCHCEAAKCEGRPCIQMVDYLSQLWNYFGKFKTDFNNFYTYMLTEPRSDIIKELTYSRQGINSCSTVSNNYNVSTRLLSCTRVHDELISPISSNKWTKDQLTNMVHGNLDKDPNKDIQINLNSGQTVDGYCYGKELGKALVNQSSGFTDPDTGEKLGLDLMDNWFCCQETKKNSSQNSNPIYNTSK